MRINTLNNGLVSTIPATKATTTLAPITENTCGKTLKVKGWSLIDGTYEILSSNGKLTLSNNKPAYFNAALKMYLYAIKSGFWHFQKTLGAPHAIAYAAPSKCPN